MYEKSKSLSNARSNAPSGYEATIHRPSVLNIWQFTTCGYQSLPTQHKRCENPSTKMGVRAELT